MEIFKYNNMIYNLFKSTTVKIIFIIMYCINNPYFSSLFNSQIDRLKTS